MTKILYLSGKDVHRVGGDDPCRLVAPVEKALGLHALGDYSQPLKPYLKIPNDRLNRRIVSMPAYLGGEIQTWGIKVIASCPDNPQERGIPRASAVIVLHDVETGVPYTIMEGAQISAARTVAMAIISCEFLARGKSRTLAATSGLSDSRAIARPRAALAKADRRWSSSVGRLAAAKTAVYCITWKTVKP